MERVDLNHQFGLQPAARWRSHGSSSSRCRFVALGQLADGRWYASLSREPGGAHVFDAGQGEQLARRLAADWMVGHDWMPMPAAFGPQGVPTVGGPWVRRGAEWVLAD